MFGTLNPRGNNNSTTPAKSASCCGFWQTTVSPPPWSSCKRDWDAGVKPCWDKEFRGEEEKPPDRVTRDTTTGSKLIVLLWLNEFSAASRSEVTTIATAAEDGAKHLTWQSEGSSADGVTVLTHPLAPARGGWQRDTDRPGLPRWQLSGSFK